MNGATASFAVALSTNLRYLPHRLAWHVTQMSTGRPRSTLKLRSRSAFCSGYCDVANRPRSHALTTFSTRSPSRTWNDHEVHPRVWPPVMCAVSASGPRRIVSPSLNRWSTLMAGYPTTPIRARALSGRIPSGVVATGGEGIGTRFARPQCGTRRLLEHSQSAGMVGMGLRVQEDLDVLDVE